MTEENITVIVENARIDWLNFKGEERQYNAAGKRNFCLFPGEAKAEEWAKDGWKIKITKPPKNAPQHVIDEFVPEPYIQIDVGYKFKPARVFIIGSISGERTELGEDMVSLVDDLDILNVDLSFRNYDWEVGDGSGRKAKLKSAYITYDEDPLEAKYAQHQTP